ncbi:hypothetical protein M569_06677, partial [Genlisea aurea]
MVLSRKKRKQKIRASKAQLIMALKDTSEFFVNDLANFNGDDSKTTVSLKNSPDQSPQGSRISKREKRRLKVKQDDSEVSNVGGNSFEELKREVEPHTKVYVGGIPYYSTEDDIKSYFEHCGSIKNIDCMRFEDSGKFRGIAIITFKIEAAAKRALGLDGSEMGGFFLKIQPFKYGNRSSNFSPSVTEGYRRIYVGNLAWDTTEGDLRKQFSDFKVTSVRLGKDRVTGEFKGYAHVDFADEASFFAALKLDQSVMGGRPIRISCAVTAKKDRETDLQEAKKMKNKNDKVVGSSKVKRRTCYECGEKGHLSSSCPR